ncbi:MAG TPA: outer membrane protein [Xanthobacteraceae bacterium]|nr:outer membrane protein [Xanthobacteraceae bacterium]
MKTKIIIAALLATVATLGSASAADLSRPMYTKAPPPPPLYNWTGFYVGVNVGGSWGHQDVTGSGSNILGSFITTNSTHIDGVIGGGQIGYNWQGMGSPWVFGLEADIQGSGQKGDGALSAPGGIIVINLAPNIIVPPSSLTYEDKLDWFGTVRGRIGYAVGDQGRWLPYITGGLAYGESKLNGNASLGGANTLTSVAFSQSKTDVGWTVGAGIEWAFWDKWSAKLEYLYMDLGDSSTIALTPAATLTTGRMTDNIVRVGANLHF